MATWAWYRQVIMHLLFSALFIIVARVVDVSMSTMRVAFIARGKKYLAASCGFFEILIWITVVGRVLTGNQHFVTYVAYAVGFSCGTLMGMFLEERLAVGWSLVRVITVKPVRGVMQNLSAAGFGVTLQDGFGSRGPVQIMVMLIPRKQLHALRDILTTFDPEAFYTVEDIRHARDIPAAYATAATGAGKTPIPL